MSEKKIHSQDAAPRSTAPLLVLLSALMALSMLYAANQQSTVRIQQSSAGLDLAVEATKTVERPLDWKQKITVTFQGKRINVAADSTASDLLSENSTNTLQYYGDLLDVGGEIIEIGKGEGPAFTVSGVAQDGDTPLAARDTISVHRGPNLTEGTVTVKSDIRTGYTRTGKGAIPTLLSPGRSGITGKTTGKLSGKIVSEGLIAEPINAVMDYKQYQNPSDKVIALTFDDGPHQKDTQAIVNALRDGGAKATFFMLARNVDREPALARMVVDGGNEVGIHSYNHQLMTNQSVEQMREDLARSSDAILKATGQKPIWVRPPYGAVDGTVYATLAQQNFHVALWSVDTYDWKKPGVATIVNRAKNGFPGAVILMHDGGGKRDQTAAALPEIIKYYKDAGYRFVTLSEYQALIDGAEKK